MVKVRKRMNAPLFPHHTDRQTERQADTYSKTHTSGFLLMKRWWRSTGVESGAEEQTRTLPTLRVSAFPPAAELLSWCWWKKKILVYIFLYIKNIFVKNIHKSLTVFSSSDLQMAQDNKWCQWNPRLGPWFLIWMGQKCAAVMINKWLVVAAWRPDCTFTLSLWGRPNDFYLPLRKHIKAISDCGGSSVLDHAAVAVLAEAWLVSVGSSFCSLCKQKEALRKSSWLIPFASIPLLKAVRRLPGKPNMTAKPKHDSARWRTRHSWGIEHGNAF